MKKLITLCLALSCAATFAQNGLDFDGINDYATAATGGPTGSSNRTVECWIKTSKSVSTQQTIFDWGQMSPNGSRFTLNMIDFGKVRIEVGGNGFNSTISVADGNWHHIAITYDHTATLKFKMYIDGVLHLNSNTTVAVNTAITGGYFIGTRNDQANYFDGVIDEVRVWNVVRTATEIQASMNAEFCTNPPGLVSYYKFNQGMAGGSNAGINSLINALGSNNGVLNGFALSGSSSNWVAGKNLASGSTTPGSATIVACDSYTAQSGAVWTTSGNYVDTITSSTGCDSLVNITLTINQSSTGTMSATACNQYVSPSGNFTWTTSGTYVDILTNSKGCDSVLTINLIVENVDIQVLQNGIVLTSWATGAAYQWLDCNNGFAPVPGATGQTFVPTVNGSYAVQVNKNGCIDTSGCYTVFGVGVDENHTNYFDVFPNPSHGEFTIWPIQTIDQGTLSIYSIAGKLVYETSIAGSTEINVKTALPAGYYMVHVQTSQGIQRTPLIIN